MYLESHVFEEGEMDVVRAALETIERVVLKGVGSV